MIGDLNAEPVIVTDEFVAKPKEKLEVDPHHDPPHPSHDYRHDRNLIHDYRNDHNLIKDPMARPSMEATTDTTAWHESSSDGHQACVRLRQADTLQRAPDDLSRRTRRRRRRLRPIWDADADDDDGEDAVLEFTPSGRMMIDILDLYGMSFKSKTLLGERHDTEINDETNYFFDRGPAALAASLTSSIALFASSTASP